jgi:nitroimidazol reductase NimA-like FMN-containing flavoprotein (pyridoxamine 5'-phosphate oxidase superfamily)
MQPIENAQHSGGGHPHAVMRRKEREITDPHEIEAILREGKQMYLALADGDQPLVVPLFYAYDGTSLFFHSAKSGTKIEVLKRNNRVSFAVSLDHGIIESDRACDFEAQHRTVVGYGHAHFIDDEGEKAAALHRIVAQFTDRKFEFPAASLAATAVIRIDVTLLKGKKHGM